MEEKYIIRFSMRNKKNLKFFQKHFGNEKHCKMILLRNWRELGEILYQTYEENDSLPVALFRENIMKHHLKFFIQMFNGQSIRGRFERDGWTKIVGNEGDLKVCYQIQEGKLVETISGNGYTFKQVSTENLHCSKLGINWYIFTWNHQLNQSEGILISTQMNNLNVKLEFEFSDVLTWNVLNLFDTIILIIEFLVTLILNFDISVRPCLALLSLFKERQ